MNTDAEQPTEPAPSTSPADEAIEADARRVLIAIADGEIAVDLDAAAELHRRRGG